MACPCFFFFCGEPGAQGYIRAVCRTIGITNRQKLTAPSLTWTPFREYSPKTLASTMECSWLYWAMVLGRLLIFSRCQPIKIKNRDIIHKKKKWDFGWKI